MSPDYSFSDEDRKGLQSFIRSAMPSLLHRVPIEVSQRYVDRFRCNVCHDRDGDPNLLGDVLYEESLTGLPPERVPNITWVGEKLHRQWMENQFAGRLEYRARPWMKLRMPRYPTRAFDLASGLAAEHGIVDLQPLALTTDAKSVSLGHQLTLQAPRGFFCVQCHAVGEQPPAGASDHRGVNFVYVRDRIRRDYFIRWITNPLRLDPGSKMPTFAPDGKMTNIATVYGGDAQRQFAAIWEYLRSLKKQMSEPTTVPRPRAPKPGH
jgi:mono/diheme cytochrome c family protein